jgi:hypothetical protein
MPPQNCKVDSHFKCGRIDCNISTYEMEIRPGCNTSEDWEYLIDSAFAQLPIQSEEQLRGIRNQFRPFAHCTVHPISEGGAPILGSTSFARCETMTCPPVELLVVPAPPISVTMARITSAYRSVLVDSPLLVGAVFPLLLLVACPVTGTMGFPAIQIKTFTSKLVGTR